MGVMAAPDVRLAASADDVDVAAQLLDAFNREFGTPTPGPEAIVSRLGGSGG